MLCIVHLFCFSNHVAETLQRPDIFKTNPYLITLYYDLHRYGYASM